jgi:Dyp-type peroxidase family
MLDRSDIQGDIVRAYGKHYDYTSYLFFHVPDGAAGRAWLGGLVDTVSSDAPWSGGRPPCHTNVAFTCTGLRALGVPEEVLETFSEEFRQGMTRRADWLGDTGPSAPENWEPELASGRAHVLVTLNALDDGARDEVVATLEASQDVELVYELHAQQQPGAVREHFGFADGFAQPAIEGVSDDPRGGGVPLKGGGWRPLAPGEFILGYEDEDSRVDPKRRLPNAPADPLGRSGTYMVWRKLHQDVALFRRTLAQAAAGYPGGEEELAAKIVGRARDGTPLIPSKDPANTNDFRYYEEDRDGRRCPLGAHIRRSNPRDALGWDGHLSFRHRIIRRGMPYGDPLPDGVTEDDKQPRGLVFVAFNASISRQFEGIQVQWLNAGNIFGLGHDKDYILGDSVTTAKMTVQGDPPYFISPQPSFVTTRGGEYLFVPGITALAAIADGVAG